MYSQSESPLGKNEEERSQHQSNTQSTQEADSNSFKKRTGPVQVASR